jgi:hypothetical protein
LFPFEIPFLPPPFQHHTKVQGCSGHLSSGTTRWANPARCRQSLSGRFVCDLRCAESEDPLRRKVADLYGVFNVKDRV